MHQLARSTRPTNRKGQRSAPQTVAGMSRHAQSRMDDRRIRTPDVKRCKLHGRWMRNPASGQVVLAWEGILLGVKPFGKAIATVMRGGTSGYVPFRPRKRKQKRKYRDAKHVWAFQRGRTSEYVTFSPRSMKPKRKYKATKYMCRL